MSGHDELEARRQGRSHPAGPSETDLERQLEEARAEADELRGRLEAARRGRRELEAELEGAGESVRHWRQETEILARRAAALEGEARRRTEELAAARRSLLREQKRVADATSRLEAKLKQREASLETQKHRLEAATEQLAQVSSVARDVERAAGSRSWRFGHRTMRVLRRITFRRLAPGEDSLERAAANLRKLGDSGKEDRSVSASRDDY